MSVREEKKEKSLTLEAEQKQALVLVEGEVCNKVLAL